MTKESFQQLVDMISECSIFYNNSNNPQEPVELQTMIALQRLGHSGNGASFLSVATDYSISGM